MMTLHLAWRARYNTFIREQGKREWVVMILRQRRTWVFYRKPEEELAKYIKIAVLAGHIDS